MRRRVSHRANATPHHQRAGNDCGEKDCQRQPVGPSREALRAECGTRVGGIGEDAESRVPPAGRLACSGHPRSHRSGDAQDCGADAVILADLGLLAHAAERRPNLRLHLSVQAAAANADAINFYAREFGVKRVFLPRVLTVQEIAAINREIDVETEVFIFGGLCVMAEGRCSLSSYATGKSPNMNGVCSPPSHVEYREEGGDLVSRLGGYAIHKSPRAEAAPYPTLCKGCFKAGDHTGHVFEDPVSLDAASLIPQLADAGVTALKIEGRQRSRAYTEAVVRSFRCATDAQAAGLPLPANDLRKLTEGQQTTAGAYRKTWR